MWSVTDTMWSQVTKGAPQKILELCVNHADVEDRLEAAVQELADRGFRSLAVALSHTDQSEESQFEMLVRALLNHPVEVCSSSVEVCQRILLLLQGIISLHDPPRKDAKQTIRLAHENLIEVKMITGDQAAIARETCRALGMGTNVRSLCVCAVCARLVAASRWFHGVECRRIVVLFSCADCHSLNVEHES